VKRAVAILVIFCLMTQCVIQLGILGYYELNKAYIAKNLCENRNRPELKCCGKCYLNKQLKKAGGDENGSKNLPNKIEKNEVLVFLLPPPLRLLKHAFSETVIKNPVLQSLYDSKITRAFFHPPSVCC